MKWPFSTYLRYYTDVEANHKKGIQVEEKISLHKEYCRIIPEVSIIHQLDRCLAKYSHRSEANNAIPCNIIRNNEMIMIVLSWVRLKLKRWVI